MNLFLFSVCPAISLELTRLGVSKAFCGWGGRFDHIWPDLISIDGLIDWLIDWLIGAVSSNFFDLFNSMTYYLKRSIDLIWLFDPVLSPLDDLVTCRTFCHKANISSLVRPLSYHVGTFLLCWLVADLFEFSYHRFVAIPLFLCFFFCICFVFVLMAPLWVLIL